MKTRYLTVICLAFLVGVGARAMSLEELKMTKRFGIGMTAGGPLSVLGIQAELNITESFAATLGIGTGLDYSTLAFEGKYFLLGKEVSPYFGLGFARWWTNGTKSTDLGPAVLRNIFLDTQDYSQGFSVWMVYPALGVQFLHPMGMSVYAEVQYLFKLFNFANGTYAGLGMSWFF